MQTQVYRSSIQHQHDQMGTAARHRQEQIQAQTDSAMAEGESVHRGAKRSFSKTFSRSDPHIFLLSHEGPSYP